MKSYLVPVVMITRTYGHIPVWAESMDKAKAISLSQEQMAYMFRTNHSNQVSYEIESNKKQANY